MLGRKKAYGCETDMWKPPLILDTNLRHRKASLSKEHNEAATSWQDLLSAHLVNPLQQPNVTWCSVDSLFISSDLHWILTLTTWLLQYYMNLLFWLRKERNSENRIYQNQFSIKIFFKRSIYRGLGGAKGASKVWWSISGLATWEIVYYP